MGAPPDLDALEDLDDLGAALPHSGACGGSKDESRASCGRTRWEVADVFRLYADEYRRTHRLPLLPLQTMHDIEVCRTAALGGHLERCTACDFERPAYDSCRNRHCPKCQSVAKLAWLEAQSRDLLPVPYFHAVFTLPHRLNPLVLGNLRPCVDLLFQSTAATLRAFSRNELGGTLGFLAFLHTWDQLLQDHFHLHCLIPAGALAPDGSRWIATSPDYLFPVEALGAKFRGRFLAELKDQYRSGNLSFGASLAPLGEPSAFYRLVDELFQTNWVVYCKPALDGAEAVLGYLARYTYRTAISNNRIVSVGDDKVAFRYRDRTHDGEHTTRIQVLDADEFIRRFLLHVLPKNLQRIRRFGFLANRAKKAALAHCRRLLAAPAPPPALPKPFSKERIRELTGIDLFRCPKCRTGTMVTVARIDRAAPSPAIPRATPAPTPVPTDTS